MNIITEFSIFKLVSWYQISVLSDNFEFFWPDLSKKSFSDLKQQNWSSYTFCIILHIQISLVRYFSSNWQFDFLDQTCPKMYFLLKIERKSEHHHGILHIWISLGGKFQLKLIILSFWTKFTQKRYFQLKTEQAV